MAEKRNSKGIWIVAVAALALVSMVAMDQLKGSDRDAPAATEVGSQALPQTGNSGTDETVATPPATRAEETAPTQPAGPSGNM